MIGTKGESEFETARRARQRKIAAQRMRTLVIFGIVFTVLVAAIYFIISEDVVGIIGDRIAASTAASGGMPVDIAGTNVRSIFECGDGIGIVTDASVNLYSKEGSRLLYYGHTMVNPVSESSGRKFLLFDQGGTELHVRTRDKVYFENIFDYKIINAGLSENGWLFAVTNAQRYASQLHIWDSTYEKEIFTWSASDEYIIDACIHESSKTVAAVSLSADSYGEMVSTVKVFSLESGNMISKKSFTDTAAVSIDFDSSGNIKLICDNMAVMLNRSCVALGTQYFSDTLIGYINGSGTDYSVLFFDRYTQSRTTGVMMLGKNFSVTKNTAASGEYVFSDGNSSSFVLYSGGKAYLYDLSGNLTAIYSSESDAVKVKLVGTDVFAVTRDVLCQLTE